jgi:hypothetical protein
MTPKGRGKKKVIHKVVNNITIHNYFGAGPSQAPPDDGRPTEADNLFPVDERTHAVPVPWHCNAGTRNVLASRAKHDGSLTRGCTGCTRSPRPMDDFAPQDSIRCHRLRAAFYEAMAAYRAAWVAKDVDAARAARADVEERARTECPSCTKELGHLSPAQKECKDLYVAERQRVCALQNGCRFPDCPERGTEAWCVLEGDHIVKTGWVHAPGHYMYWAYHGGAEALQLEFAKLQWPCRFCHRLEPTSASGNRCIDPNTMPEGKSTGTAEEVAQYEAHRKATIRYPKQQYVDARKRAIGACARCRRAVTAGTEQCFDFDHKQETAKIIGRDTVAGVNGGVAGMVGNSRVDTCIVRNPAFKDVLDAEMAKCELLCANCHHRKSWGYPPRAPVA